MHHPETTLCRYFYAGSTRVTMRVVDGATNPTYWLLNDHLGSTAITADANGTKTAELRFKAWGEQRYASGTTPTTYRYTGQREQSQLSIYYYGARWYDPNLSRFLLPDTIVPGMGSQVWDRYAYVMNNPVRFIDPTGHVCSDPEDPTPSCETGRPPRTSGHSNRRSRSVPVVPLKFKPDKKGTIRYDREETWKSVSTSDLLARFLISEQMSGILNPETSIDAVGVAWTMKNRLNDKDFFDEYADKINSRDRDKVLRAIILAAGGLSGAYGTGCGDPCPGNAAYAANPEAYPKQFGGHPKEVYWTAVSIAQGVLSGSIPDPTKGATNFADAMYNSDGKIVPYPDGRTHFSRDGTASYSLP